MKTFTYDGRLFNAIRHESGLILVAPGRTKCYQPADVLAPEIQKLAAAVLGQ